MSLSLFALPDSAAGKLEPSLISRDAEQFAAITATLEEQIEDHTQRLDTARRSAGGGGTAALERDQLIHHLTARLRTLGRYGPDLCLGRIVPQDGADPVYIGRFGLTDADGHRLLVDWRSPAAEPFFAATPVDPMGVRSRRRYQWAAGRVRDYWDEALTDHGADTTALDPDAAFLASLARNRTGRMQDVLATIQTDQHRIVRAPAAGALVIDGGPGTGKTVVALHRVAHLLYSEPQLGPGRGAVLVLGPHRPYLRYIADVLPSLGEEGVQAATVSDLVPESVDAGPEPDAQVAALKADPRMLEAIEAGIRWYQECPQQGLHVPTPWDEVWFSPRDWELAFAAASEGAPHHEARAEIWEAVIETLLERHGTQAPEAAIERALRAEPGLRAAFHRAWPVLEAHELIGDLWTVPAFLRLCAPWLTIEQVRSLQRGHAQAWTDADLPLLDAARAALGPPEPETGPVGVSAVEREARERVAAELMAADDGSVPVAMLAGRDLQDALVSSERPVGETHDLLGPFAHIVIDEAQELTTAQWQMVLRRCPSRSLTIVGDRAQARTAFTETWEQRLAQVGAGRVRLEQLSINYRTPAEVMERAEPQIRAAVPDANVPASIRHSGLPVRDGDVADLEEILTDWLARNAGTACVIGTREELARAGAPALSRQAEWRTRVSALTPAGAKGLEFDLVILVRPDALGSDLAGAVDRYVAMTRSTAELVVLD